MSFLAPLFLSLGLAAAVPLLLHLMRRRLGARVEFPAARYLARAEQEHSRRLRLRNLLLMLLRVAVILLIASAAARPVGRVAGTGHPPTALAIVIDNSLSSSAVVDGEPVLDELRQIALQVLDRAAPEDRLWLVTADGTVQGGTESALREAITALEPLAGGGDVPGAVARATGIVEASGVPARQVMLLTDGRATAFDREPDRLRVPVVAYQPAGEPPPNRWVERAEARPVRFTPRGNIVARVGGSDSAAYTVAVGDNVVARGVAEAGEEIVIRAVPPGAGWMAGSVELPPDELRGDDRRYFAVWRGEPPAVRVDASAGEFAASALATLVESERAVRGSNVLIAGADAADRLPALLFAPTDPVRLGSANRNLERLGVPWRFGAPRRAQVDVQGERLQGVSVSLWYPLERVAGAPVDTVARAGGAAWVVAGEGYVLVGSPASPDATTLPLRASFVPWLGDLFAERLAAEPGIVVPAAPGARVRVPDWVTAWEGPAAGQQLIVDGVVTAPADPGTYFLLRGSARVGALVVNPEPEASQLERLSPGALRSRLGVRDAEITSQRDRFIAAAFDPGAGRSLAGPLLLGALLVLGVEGWVSRRGGGRR